MMKKKDIVAQIKEESNNVVIPDLKEKIIIQAKATRPVKEVYVEEKKDINRTIGLRPRWQLAFMCIISVLILSFTIISVLNNRPDMNSGNNNQDGDIVDNNSITDIKKTYMVQAVTLGGLVSSYDDTLKLSSKKQTMRRTLLGGSTENFDEISDDINNYLYSVEELFNQDKYEYSFIESDREGYAYKAIIKTNLPNLTSSFIIYYNERMLVEDDEKDIDEVSSILEGIIIIDEETYDLIGEKEIEEDETEIELRLYLSSDKSKYLEVSQEIKHLENEYSYAYYENNQLIDSFEVEKEIEKNKKKVTLEVTTKGKESEYEFIYNNDNTIDVEYHHHKGNHGKVKININGEKYEYQFENHNHKIEHNRWNHKKNKKK